jgi:hypothetical protein
MVVAKPADDEKNPYMKLVVTGLEKGGDNAVAVLLEEYRKWIRRKVISKQIKINFFFIFIRCFLLIRASVAGLFLLLPLILFLLRTPGYRNLF